MTLETIPYPQYLQEIPDSGQYILAQQTVDQVVVYQAFHPSIADFAVANQCFGGPDYSYQRMSWIKPNFLWMMYRCGWASKPNQERVLAIWLRKTELESILAQAVYSSFSATQYANRETWKAELRHKQVRLQWDPDHDPHGQPQTRRAIQLGIKGHMLQRFGKEMVGKIEDITPFVHQQAAVLQEKRKTDLLVPRESIFLPTEPTLQSHLGLS
jgi:hypothetical protein